MRYIVEFWMILIIVIGLINSSKRIKKYCCFVICFVKWKKSLKLVGKLAENYYLCVLIRYSLTL